MHFYLMDLFYTLLASGLTYFWLAFTNDESDDMWFMAWIPLAGTFALIGLAAAIIHLV